MKNELLGLVLILTIHATMSCSLIKIDKSENRNPTIQTILLDEDLDVSSTGLTKISKSDFFPSSFRINANNTIIYIDPLAVETNEKADIICITHAHPDHFSKTDIKKLTSTDTWIICPRSVAKKLKKNEGRLVVVKPGDKIDYANDKTIEAVEAYNLNTAFLWLKAHPRSKQNVGFVFNLNGKRIYHAGDTDFVPEMKNIKNIDLALVPVGGDNLTMGPVDAVEFISQLKPEIAVPIHYEAKNRSELEILARHLDKEIKIRIFD